MVGQFDTLESAEAVAAQMRSAGEEVVVSLIGGLSVIASNRSLVPHVTRCQPFMRAPSHSWAHDDPPLRFVTSPAQYSLQADPEWAGLVESDRIPQTSSRG